MINRSTINFPSLLPFEVNASYVEINRKSPENQHDSHVHPECEIYINLSGDVSFMVEKQVYPVSRGSIVITRPYEYHRCIYHSDELHRHFWILFSTPSDSDAVRLSMFKKFFDRPTGQNNLLFLEPASEEELISLCHDLSSGELDGERKFSVFFRIIELIGTAKEISPKETRFPAEIDSALALINKSYTDPALKISYIADEVGVSVNTLERYFRRHLSSSPTDYIKKKRLAAAAKMLSRGGSVSEVSERCGFSDYSHFIALFKKAYGTTPLKYKSYARENKKN